MPYFALHARYGIFKCGYHNCLNLCMFHSALDGRFLERSAHLLFLLFRCIGQQNSAVQLVKSNNLQRVSYDDRMKSGNKKILISLRVITVSRN